MITTNNYACRSNLETYSIIIFLRMYVLKSENGFTLHKEMMHLPETIGYHSKISVLGMNTFFQLTYQGDPRKVHKQNKILPLLLVAHRNPRVASILLLKIIYTWIIGHSEINLVLTLKLSSCCLAFVEPESTWQDAGKEKPPTVLK